MSGAGRPLAAAPSNYSNSRRPDGPSDPDGHRDRNLPAKRAKRTLIESACVACRKRKSRCDGARPICARCVALRTECVYEAQQGESRWAALRRTSDGLESQRDELREIVAYLRSQPESEALEVFHRLRNQGQNDSLTAILQWIRARGTSVQAFGGPDGSASRTQQLPPLRTMVNMQNMQPNHAARGGNHGMRSQSLTSDGSGSSRSYESSASGEDGAAVQSGAA